jgi:hypothetical protein
MGNQDRVRHQILLVEYQVKEVKDRDHQKREAHQLPVDRDHQKIEIHQILVADKEPPPIYDKPLYY